MELPYHFPDPLEEAARRAREFQRLPPDERFRQLMEVVATGLILIQLSPRRPVTDRLFEVRESEWQRIQKELFIRHGA